MIIEISNFDIGVVFVLSLILLEVYSLVKANQTDHAEQSRKKFFINIKPYSLKLYLIVVIFLLVGCAIKSFFVLILCPLVLLTEIFYVLVNNINIKHKNKQVLPFVFGTKFSTSRIVVYTQLCFFLAICLFSSYAFGTSNVDLVGIMFKAAKILGKGGLSIIKKIDKVKVAESATAGLIVVGVTAGVSYIPTVISYVPVVVEAITPLAKKLSYIGHREGVYLAEDLADWYTAKLDSFTRVYDRHLPLNMHLYYNYEPKVQPRCCLDSEIIKVENLNFPKPVPTIREENWKMVSEVVNDILDEIIENL